MPRFSLHEKSTTHATKAVDALWESLPVDDKAPAPYQVHRLLVRAFRAGYTLNQSRKVKSNAPKV